MTLKNDPGCTRCSLHKTTESVCVLGRGPDPCRIMIISEVPGKYTGGSEDYLNTVLKDVGFAQDEIFRTSAVSCKPPDNLKPTKKQVESCGYWLRYQIVRIKPKYVLLLGNAALRSITGHDGITKHRGKPFEKDRVVFLPVYSPSYILHGEYAQDPVFRQDLRLFKTLVDGGGMPREKSLSIKVVETDQDFELMLKNMIGTVSFDIETSGLYPWAKLRPKELPEKYKKDPMDPRAYNGKVISLGFGTRKHQWVMLTSRFELTQPRLTKISERLRDCIVVGHYAKFDALFMRVNYGVKWRIDFDTGLAHYMLDENTRHGLKELAQRFCGAPNWDIDKETKQTFANERQGITYHAHDLYYTRKLKFIFQRELEKDPLVYRVFRSIMMPLIEVFVEAELEGPFIDLAKMNSVEKDLRAKIGECESKLSKWGNINWGSPLQLASVLFKKLKIRPIAYGKKKTKDWPEGVPSTAETVLKQIDHPIVKDLMVLRGAKQQLSFFIEGWKPYIVNGRLHPSFKLTGTVTGRLSCENPSLQHVPRDATIRSLIVAPPGWVLVEADLSQIELRVAAELAGERTYVETFSKGLDPHWITALSELRRGGQGGGFSKNIFETAKMFVMSVGLLPDRTGAKILLDVWDEIEDSAKSQELIPMCYKIWQDTKEERWEPGRIKKSLMERGLSDLAKTLSGKALRALQCYFESVSTPQKLGSTRREKIEFDDAVSILSRIGASEAQKFDSGWKELRKKAKAVAFGYLYGMWWKKFKIYARDKYDVILTDKQAEESRNSYFSLYRDLPDWHNRQRKFARRNGYVRTLSGRKRRLPAAMSQEDSFERGEAERQAINSPVQSFANELNFMAVIQLTKEFSRKVYRPIGTIHDSILAYVREDYVDKVAARTAEVMRHPELLDRLGIKLKIPIESEITIGPWGAGHKWVPNVTESRP